MIGRSVLLVALSLCATQAVHYEKPPCSSDEQLSSVSKYTVCVPKCSGKGACPTDAPTGVTAKPECALSDPTGNKYCVLECGSDAECDTAGGAKCALVQPPKGICYYPDAATEDTVKLKLSLDDNANYSVKHEDVTVGGYVCREQQTARVYYPSASGKFPLISFAHGYDCPGTEAYRSYSRLNTAVAAAGYVVIVLESTKWPGECANEWKDQVHSIVWAKTNLASKVDFTKKVGILGHSMGGGATYHTASTSAVKEQNIGAAVALHPQITSPLPLQPVTNSKVPIFFGTGSRDTVVSPGSVKSAYSKTGGVAKVFTEISGADHFEPMTTPSGPNRHTPFAIAMFDCHLKGNKAQCGQVYGKGSGALCSGRLKMTDCEHANDPSSEAIVV